MARILFVWELGKGFGHLAPYMGFVERLRGAGHEVIFSARDVVNAEQVFGKRGMEILQSPIMLQQVGTPYKIQYNLSHLLHNLGFGSPGLVGLVKAWRRLYEFVQPDLVIFDHSPTAMLAAKRYGWKRIVSGSGFLIPPQGVPLPMMRYWQKYDQERLGREEGAVLKGVNDMLKSIGDPPLQSMSEIYRADDMFLLGFKEMDHYPQRKGGNYLGMFSPPGHGVAPEWPAGYQRRVFAYLHPFANVGKLLSLFTQANFASVIYAPEISDSVKKKYARRNIVFSKEPIDIANAAAKCNVAVTNGTFGTTSECLMHGTPVLCVPDNLERIMVSRRVIGMKAGLGVSQKETERLKPALQALFKQDQFRRSAKAFANKYRGLDVNWQTTKMMEIVERLLAAPVKGKPAAEPGSARTAAPVAAERTHG